MLMKKIYLFISLFVILFVGSLIFTSCQKVNIDKPLEQLNTSHLDHLYEEIIVNDINMAVIHIYADYPSYNYIDDEDEGMACVDDAARAAVLYLELFKSNSNKEYLKKNKLLTMFLLYMQSDNGYFYNFMWPDNSINVEHKNSLAEPNWWSWRALWALTESHDYYKAIDSVYANKIWKSIERLVINIKNEIPSEMNTENINGLDIPTWLSNNYAADQSSVLILGLVNYYNQTNDETVKKYISILCEGIMQMQIKDNTNKYYGAFLSWQNNWHAYGNSQAYALIKANQIIKDDRILQSALIELDNFLPEVVREGYISSYSVIKNDDLIEIENTNQFSQIAYNIRPMIYSLCEAYKISNDQKYLTLAVNINKWFFGDNPAKSLMYNSKSGVVFDGINSNEEVNMNSGAESTIEALLAMQRILEYNSFIKY